MLGSNYVVMSDDPSTNSNLRLSQGRGDVSTTNPIIASTPQLSSQSDNLVDGEGYDLVTNSTLDSISKSSIVGGQDCFSSSPASGRSEHDIASTSIEDACQIGSGETYTSPLNVINDGHLRFERRGK